jgi:octaprenyl-diphosphate synthase
MAKTYDDQWKHGSMIGENSSHLFSKKMNKCRARVNKALDAELERKSDSMFYIPFKEALRDGKRIRPILLVLSYEATRATDADPFPAALAVELAHTESLIHDDIIDQDSTRRQNKAFHVLYGYETALLSADFVLSMILGITAKYSDPRINRELALATSRMSEGELEELTICRRKEHLTMEEYLRVVSKKTASLFETSTTIGAIIGKAKEDDAKRLAKYGNSLGIAYQIQDDILDLKNDKNNDLVRLLGSGPDVSLSLIQRCKSFISDAKQNLNCLQQSEAKSLLVEIADFMRTRSTR